MYELADNIVGALQLAEQMNFADVLSTSTTLSALKAMSAATEGQRSASISPSAAAAPA